MATGRKWVRRERGTHTSLHLGVLRLLPRHSRRLGLQQRWSLKKTRAIETRSQPNEPRDTNNRTANGAPGEGYLRPQKKKPISSLTTSSRPVRTRSANALVAASLSQHPHRQPPPRSAPSVAPVHLTRPPSPLDGSSFPGPAHACPMLPPPAAAVGLSRTALPPSDPLTLPWLVP